MEKVVILMSTYNGELYLQEQIDSILNQEGIIPYLIIRDDGSTDNTTTILNNYKNHYNNIEVLLNNNKGCKTSFYELCKYSIKKFPNNNFFAFADQDDVWLPNKLSEALKYLKGEDINIPLLYYCQTKSVDRDLNYLPVQSSTRDLDFPETCISYAAAGCTMVFNRVSLSLFLLAKPNQMYLHDSWMYKMVSVCGGKILADSNSYILYRQHGNNIVGSNHSRFSQLKRRMSTLFQSDNKRSSEIKNIITVYQKYISDDKFRTLKLLSDYQQNLRNKIKIILSTEIRYKEKSNFFLRMAIMFNKF